MSVSDSKIAHIVGKPKSIWNSLARSKLLIENDSNDPVIRVVIRKYVIGKTEELGSGKSFHSFQGDEWLA